MLLEGHFGVLPLALASSLLRSLVTSTKHQPNDFRVRRGTRGRRQLERFCGFPVSTNVGAGLPFFTIASRGRQNPFARAKHEASANDELSPRTRRTVELALVGAGLVDLDDL